MEKDRRLKGMQDRSLELDASGVDAIIERTEVAQQGFRGALFTADTAFTKGEIDRVREGLKLPNAPKHHPNTSLPLIRE